MNIQQLIHALIIQKVYEWDEKPLPIINIDNVDDLYDEISNDAKYDAEYEVRYGDVNTDIECFDSRHYESKSVASKINDQWIGWTFWYGGGKHGEPEAIDWMEHAYLLDCEEKEVMTIQRTFKKID